MKSVIYLKSIVFYRCAVVEINFIDTGA